MDTKSKSMNNKKYGIWLSVCYILLLTFLCVMRALYSAADDIYFRVEEGSACYTEAEYWISRYNPGRLFDISIIGMIVGVVIFLVLLNRSIHYLKTYSLKEMEKPFRVDRINLELEIMTVVILLIVILNGVYENALFGNYNYVLLSTEGMIRFAAVMLMFAGLFCTGIILLIRKKVLGLMKETSYLLNRKKRYMETTPYEIRIADTHKHFFTAVMLLLLCAIGSGIYDFYVSYATGPGIFSVLFCMTAAVLILIFFRKNNILQDTGKLAEQINAMYEGVELPDEDMVSEQSLLYESSCELKDIRTAMQKSVEKQIQSERMKIDLITNVSHDLKTPLTSMIGYTDLLIKTDLSPEARDYVDVISLKQSQLKNMIQDLFELSKATSNSEQLEMQTLDMNRLIEQIMADMEDVLNSNSVTYVKRLADEPLYFRGDNNKMYRVIQNLLENTRKYTLENTRVFVETDRVKGDVRLIIKNIASYEMNFEPDEIVERFVRADQSRSTEGHGLGLAIASSLVQNMNGNLHVETDGDLFKVIIQLPEIRTGV